MYSLKIKKIKTKNLIKMIIYTIATIVIGALHYNHLEFALTTFALLSVFVTAKFSYFTVFSFILWFSFLQEYIATINPLIAAGRLMAGIGIPIYDAELFVCIMFFFIFELFIFSVTNVLDGEKKLYQRKVYLRRNVAYVFGVLAFFLVLLAYPSLPTTGATLGRDQGFIPSSLVVPLAMLLLAIVFDNLKHSYFLKFITILALIWVLFHGDRVIVMGYLVYVLLKYMNDGRFNFNTIKSILFNKRTLIVLICLAAVLIVAIRIQTTREGVAYSLSLNDLLMSIVKQGTAGDVVFAFNCSVDMWEKGNGLGLYPYMYYISNLLPGADPSYYTAVILLEKYNTMGGGLFFTEPMISGGLLLTFIHSSVFILLLTWVCNKNTKYHSFLIIPFCLLIFRFEWYATCAGLVKMILYYVPFTYFVAHKFK